MQNAIRRVRPTSGQDAIVLIDDIGGRIRAVVRVVRIPGNDQSFVLDLIAVEFEQRFTGGSCADEALEQALDWCAQSCGDASEFDVVAYVHTQNTPCRSLLLAAEFDEALPADLDGYAVWRLTIEVDRP